jgi:hypothetical protein
LAVNVTYSGSVNAPTKIPSPKSSGLAVIGCR